MDLLIIAIILATAVLAFVLLRGRDRYLPDSETEQSIVPSITRSNLRKCSSFPLDTSQQSHLAETPRRKKYRLLNDAEQILFHRLSEALPEMQIFAQVGVAQLAQLRGRQEARRLIQMAGRGVDFVVCGADFSILAAIELSWPIEGSPDNSPEEEKRRALQSLGIPLIVYRPNNLPEADTLRREVANAIARRSHLETERSLSN